MSKEKIPHVNLMICTPGHSMMAEYVKSLMNWSGVAGDKKISWGLATGYASHVADAREIVLSGTKANELFQNKPFQGNITYDKLLWIDSDIEFLPEDVLKLYYSDKDVITGGYLLASGDVMAFKSIEEGPYKIDEVEKMRDIIEINNAGFGFICVKSGVFENLSRPWFQSANTTVKLENGSEYTFAMIGEDISWCQRVREKGYSIYFDPSVKVNHHKMMKLTWKGIRPNE
jgi:hypothetical protein